MTTEIKTHDVEQELEDAWVSLWLFVQNQIRWDSQDINFVIFWRMAKNYLISRKTAAK